MRRRGQGKNSLKNYCLIKGHHQSLARENLAFSQPPTFPWRVGRKAFPAPGRTSTAVFVSPKGPTSQALGGGQTSRYSFHYYAQQSSVRTYCVCAWAALVVRSPDLRQCSPLTVQAHEGLSSRRLPECPAPRSGWQRTCPWK